jgi:GWxTD domain-containing protein
MTGLILISERPLLHALGWTLLHFCWEGAAAGILLASVLSLLRGRSSEMRYAVSCGTLLLMVLLPFATFAVLASAPRGQESPVATSSFDRGSFTALGDPATNSNSWLDSFSAKLDDSVPWVLAAWFTGVICLLGRLNFGLMMAHRMKSVGAAAAPGELQLLLHHLSRRMGVERAVKLASSAVVQVPTVVGWLRPVILFPMGCVVGLSASQVGAVLAHELAHVKRHDYLVSIFQSMAEAFLFYHPAVWFVSRQVRREREHCCDNLAVKITGDSLGYAKALSFLEERRASIPMLALGANGGVLAMRIRRVLGVQEPPTGAGLVAIFLAALALLGAGLGVGTVAFAASQQNTSASVQSLPPKYRQWLKEDVLWIITPQERTAFLELKSNQERNKFMDQFWARRNPMPNSGENNAKAEHYRRIEFANAHFASAKTPGWKSDRGRIYIVYGPPDEIESHPGSGTVKPTDAWRYHTIVEHGVSRKNVDMTFVDTCTCGEYQLQPSTK